MYTLATALLKCTAAKKSPKLTCGTDLVVSLHACQRRALAELAHPGGSAMRPTTRAECTNLAHEIAKTGHLQADWML